MLIVFTPRILSEMIIFSEALPNEGFAETPRRYYTVLNGLLYRRNTGGGGEEIWMRKI
jgi:hypothetical protein